LGTGTLSVGDDHEEVPPYVDFTAGHPVPGAGHPVSVG
jgi:hypothetical protein